MNDAMKTVWTKRDETATAAMVAKIEARKAAKNAKRNFQGASWLRLNPERMLGQR